jgi:predicted CXXCH cytochrome family protein
MRVEWLLIAILLLGAGLPFLGKGARVRGRLAALACLAAALSGVWLWQRHLEKKLDSQAELAIPKVGRPDEYAGSDSCRACHADPYASWHRSFHRTMTQIATPESVRGNFDGVDLTLDGELYRLQRRGDEFWVDMVDPTWKLEREAELEYNSHGAITDLGKSESWWPRAQRRISLVTGSHHMQAYWIDNGHGNQQLNFPFTYLFEQERWVPRRCVFIKDPKALRLQQAWNLACIDCHATAGQPWVREDQISFDTRVAELGIACEACHGPGAEHIRRNSSPWRRYTLHFEKHGDGTIVNPARLSAKRSSEVCGRCHSVHAPMDPQDRRLHGEKYRPGDVLESKLTIIRQEFDSAKSGGKRWAWNDGMNRSAGREYNGLIESPCFQKGEMSCSSCHSMHESSPTNQLAKSMEGNEACLQCHQSLAKNLSQHTHHAADSTGSLCYNCHMPYTAYGLLKAIRSHQVSSPSVKSTLQSGRPNACNLCHLDKTLDWTSQRLSAWYQTPPEQLSAQDKNVAASILWALKGDAGQRALAAWHMGWGPAVEASGSSWLAPYLATLLDDPYPVVRYIAGRSLKRLPGFTTFSYDYIAPAPGELQHSRERALDIWRHTGKPQGNPALLLDRNGAWQQEAVEPLLKARNNFTMELLE